MVSWKGCHLLHSEYWFGLSGVGFGISNGLDYWRRLEKACVSCPGQLLHCIDATGELPPMCFAEQSAQWLPSWVKCSNQAAKAYRLRDRYNNSLKYGSQTLFTQPGMFQFIKQIETLIADFEYVIYIASDRQRWWDNHPH